MANQLESLSPLGVLARGYTVTLRYENARVITDAAELRTGDRIVTRFVQGSAVSRVERAGDLPGNGVSEREEQSGVQES